MSLNTPLFACSGLTEDFAGMITAENGYPEIEKWRRDIQKYQSKIRRWRIKSDLSRNLLFFLRIWLDAPKSLYFLVSGKGAFSP
jgi:hypothetical protein